MIPSGCGTSPTVFTDIETWMRNSPNLTVVLIVICVLSVLVLCVERATRKR